MFELFKEIREILAIVRENRHALHHILRILAPNRVLGGEMSEIGDPMALLPIAPGNSPQFEVTPTPAGVTTLLAQSAWTSSDTTNAPVTANASDPTGLSATVNIPATAVVGTSFTLTWTYTNADGTTAPVTANFTIVALVLDVTGGTLVQSV
jgi:hypothetical protein